MQSPHDALRLDVRWIGPYWRQYPVAEYFTLDEVACSDGSPTIVMHPGAVLIASAVRREFGVTKINSWYRTPAYNKSIGGSTYSQHMNGMAVDVHCQRATPERVAEFAESLGAGGIGLYNTFTHIDCAGKSRRWDERT